MSLFTGLITKKNTATARIRNDNRSLMKVPYLIAPFPRWMTRKLKSGVPTMPVIGDEQLSTEHSKDGTRERDGRYLLQTEA
ncbi:MAG: hypothetical protein QOJ93_2464 [Actinomycetota bacterium]|jgi:hypothetical protein|nr:hypothetical protein [Actinomycetota bacterium]